MNINTILNKFLPLGIQYYNGYYTDIRYSFSTRFIVGEDHHDVLITWYKYDDNITYYSITMYKNGRENIRSLDLNQQQFYIKLNSLIAKLKEGD